MEIQMIDKIAEMIVKEAESREAQNKVAAIYSVWTEVGLKLSEIFVKLNKEERDEEAAL